MIEAPKVREILAKLRQAHEQHAAILAEKMDADSGADRLASELAQAVSRREAKEKAMAISGDVPEDAFPEEVQLARVNRHRRVALARVSVVQERVAASQQAIDDLKAQLDAAWLQLGVEQCQKITDRFRQAAMALRQIQCEHLAWLYQFSNKPGVIGLGIASWVSDPVDNQSIVCSPQQVHHEDYWRPFSGELVDAVKALHHEVEAAKTK